MISIPDKLLVNLKILSKIEKNGRIARSTSGIISLESNAFYQSVKRIVSHDSRSQSVFEIQSIITEAQEKIDSLLESKYLKCLSPEYIRICEILKLLVNELPGTIKGLENLRFTYKSDVYTESQIDIILINVKSVLKNLNVKLPGLTQLIPETKLSDTLTVIPNRLTSII